MNQLYTAALSLLLVVFVSSGVNAQNRPLCGVDERNVSDSTLKLMSQLPRLMADQRARKATAERRVCRVAVDIDSDTYLEFDKDTNRIRSYVLNQIELVSKIYEREINTQLVVVYFHIWKDTEPDPYRGELNINILHSRFQTVWDNQFKQIAADKRIYLFTKAVYGAGGLGNLGGGYATAYIGTYVIAHELGHNFGSLHTHACSWPGGPIDYCSTPEGTCYSESIQDMTGSIMSYCGSNTLSFHPLCQTLMTDHAVKNFSILTAPDKAPVLPTQLTLSGVPFLYWNGTSMADLYEIEVAEDAGFSKKVLSDTTGINGYNVAKLTPGQVYYTRVRATNKLGVSTWSGVCQLRLAAAGTTAAPVLLQPTSDQTQVPYTNVSRQFTVQPVNGATAYEIQLAYGYDESFKTPFATKISPAASFTMAMSAFGVVRWRVRAVLGTQNGPWSTIGRFFVNQLPAYFYRSFYDSGPLTFPYAYYPAISGSTVQVIVGTDSLFTKPVYTRTFRDSGFYTDILKDLTPNTQYYIKFDETNQTSDYPAGVLSRLVQSFKTGTATLSSRWSLINSTTYPSWPQGYANGTLELSSDAVWYANANGPTRISQDSLKLQVFNKETTKGKIGNVGAVLSGDGNGAMWVTNRTAVNIFKGGFAVPYYQAGKISEQNGVLTERTDYYTNSSFSGFNASQRLFYAYNGIFQTRADSLAKIYSVPEKRSINQTIVRPGVVWMIQSNSSSTTAPYELVQFNLITKATRVFNADNTPQLRKYLNTLATDGFGNLWVSQSGDSYPFPPLAKFDGQTWTAIDKSTTMPISYARNMANDPAGNLYIVDNNTAGTLYKYDGITWRRLDDLPLLNLGMMTADAQGNVWFNGPFQVLRYAACANAPTPTLTTAKATIEIGESTTLRAAGCQDVLWSWTSETETVTNRLVRGTNQLVVKPDASTTYRSRCYTTGCSGDEVSTTLTVLPKITLTKTNKTAFCQGDSLTTGYGLQGKVAATNQFSFVFKSGSQSTSLPATLRGTGLSVVLPTSLTPGRYVLYLETTQPVVRTRDSIQVVIAALPTAELSTSKLTFPLGDSARISVALTGLAPWRFIRGDGQSVQTASSPYQFDIKATQPANYTVAISALSDVNCAVGTVKNSLVVSALALAIEPIAVGGISVYPNPTTGRLTVEATMVTAPLSILRLHDGQGRELLRKQPTRTRHDEWDISTMPNGLYILHVETTDGKSANWKVIKQ